MYRTFFSLWLSEIVSVQLLLLESVQVVAILGEHRSCRPLQLGTAFEFKLFYVFYLLQTASERPSCTLTAEFLEEKKKRSSSKPENIPQWSRQTAEDAWAWSLVVFKVRKRIVGVLWHVGDAQEQIKPLLPEGKVGVFLCQDCKRDPSVNIKLHYRGPGSWMLIPEHNSFWGTLSLPYFPQIVTSG